MIETPSESGNMMKKIDVNIQQLDLKLDAEYLLFVMDVLADLSPPKTEKEQRMVRNQSV